ncbi:unnamed protein product [Mytilus coruscus]|uniref:Uncharacterized protein n=1 Tax=Mytilus coruscus TaxID=42192 RepID=A0A6J8BIR3_MYTCO|nr:unnamed protein product [Mytilus coruscus]
MPGWLWVFHSKDRYYGFYCTDFSEDENWTSGENTLTYTFRESSDQWCQIGVSWRRDYSTHTQCDASTKDIHDLIGYGTGDMVCLDGCGFSTAKIGTMEFYCTDFSEDENWTSGENTLTYTFRESSDQWYQIGFKGNAWIHAIIDMRGTDWILRTTASLVTRNDTGKINSSPKSVMQPIVRLQLGCNHTIAIPGIKLRVHK